MCRLTFIPKSAIVHREESRQSSPSRQTQGHHAFTAGRCAGPKLLDCVRAAIRARYYSLRTEEAYVGWIRRFILFHNKRHPAEMGEAEINQFLTNLAVAGNVAASMQNQALAAILFLLAGLWVSTTG